MTPSRARGRIAASLALALIATATVAWASVWSSPATAAVVPTYPVLLVHGFYNPLLGQTEAGARQSLSTMRDRLVLEGYDVTVVQLPSGTSNPNLGNDNRDGARYIQSTVASVKARTGAPKVSIVAHSMGGLSSLYYLKVLGGWTNVGAWVGLGVAPRGFISPLVCGSVPIYWGSQLCASSPFIGELRPGDDTPSAGTGPDAIPYYTTMWSVGGDTSDARLDGGACHVPVPGGIPHDQEVSNEAFLSRVVVALTGTCPANGTFQTYSELPPITS